MMLAHQSGQEHLAPALLPCPTCGVLVISRVWIMARGKREASIQVAANGTVQAIPAQEARPGCWQELAAPVTAALGKGHGCVEQVEG